VFLRSENTHYLRIYIEKNMVLSFTSSTSQSSVTSGDRTSDIFKEAEDYLSSKFTTLLSVATHCGLTPANTDRATEEGYVPDWRESPKRSGSDYVLNVSDGTGKVKSYHVHKTMLVYGERRSRTLEKHLQEELAHNNPRSGGRAKGSGVYEIVVPKRAAHLMPQLLDYIYSDKLDLDSDHAPALRSLSNRLDVRSLYQLVSSFIQSDLSISNVTRYLRQADLVKDKELTNLTMDLAATQFPSLDDSALSKIPPYLFPKLLGLPQVNSPSSEWLSERIGVYLRSRSDVDDEEFFLLTHAQLLPQISAREALWFLNHCITNFMPVLDDTSMGGYETSLKRRCVVSIGREWRHNLAPMLTVEQDKRQSRAMGSTVGAAGENPRRRLFEDGDQETELYKGMGYASLPVDIKVEILEEVVLRAAHEGEGNTFGTTSRTENGTLYQEKKGMEDSTIDDTSDDDDDDSSSNGDSVDADRAGYGQETPVHSNTKSHRSPPRPVASNHRNSSQYTERSPRRQSQSRSKNRYPSSHRSKSNRRENGPNRTSTSSVSPRSTRSKSRSSHSSSPKKRRSSRSSRRRN